MKATNVTDGWMCEEGTDSHWSHFVLNNSRASAFSGYVIYAHSTDDHKVEVMARSGLAPKSTASSKKDDDP